MSEKIRIRNFLRSYNGHGINSFDFSNDDFNKDYKNIFMCLFRVGEIANNKGDCIVDSEYNIYLLESTSECRVVTFFAAVLVKLTVDGGIYIR